MIAEQVDASSHLNACVARVDNFGENLRWSAGPLIGGLDWLLEQLVGISVIAQIAEPFAGDWDALDQATQAWGQVAGACDGVALNYADLSRQAAPLWVGDAGTAFGARMESIADSFTQYGDGARAMSEATDALVDLSQGIAETIAGILGFLGDCLARIAAQAAVPVVGWATAAVDAGVSTVMLLDKARRAIQLIERIIRFVERFRTVIVALTRALQAIQLLLNLMATSANIGTVLNVNDATSVAFGAE